jgi:hypothetical protein
MAKLLMPVTERSRGLQVPPASLPEQSLLLRVSPYVLPLCASRATRTAEGKCRSSSG